MIIPSLLYLINFILPAEEKLKGKRKRSKIPDPASWKSNIRRAKRNTGEAYISTSGKEIRPRSVKEKDCSACVKKCSKTFSDEDRNRIHQLYWGMGSLQARKQFVANMVKEAPVKRQKTPGEGRRSMSRNYFLPAAKSNDRKEVCKGFFLATLDISGAVVENVLKNVLCGGVMPIIKRGKSANNKISADKEEEDV